MIVKDFRERLYFGDLRTEIEKRLLEPDANIQYSQFHDVEHNISAGTVRIRLHRGTDAEGNTAYREIHLREGTPEYDAFWSHQGLGEIWFSALLEAARAMEYAPQEGDTVTGTERKILSERPADRAP